MEVHGEGRGCGVGMAEVGTQSEYRDGETQTKCIDFDAPHAWELVLPHPSFLLEDFPRISKRHHLKVDADGEKKDCLLFARDKKGFKSTNSMLYPKKTSDLQKNIANQHARQEANETIFEPFASLSLDDFQKLEHILNAMMHGKPSMESAKKINDNSVLSSPWLNNLLKELKGSHNKSRRRSSSHTDIQSKTTSDNILKKSYSTVHMGKHQKVSTPRCDPSVAARMERSKAAILLQRCLRGRAAQIAMEESRIKVMHLYKELNALERHSIASTVHSEEEAFGVKAFAGQHLFDLFHSYLPSKEQKETKADSNVPSS